MSHVGRKIRVALVQFDPQFGEVARNQATAAELLAPLESADIVVLSEMVFTGYVFNSKQEVAPFVERGGTGATFEWCRRQAQRLGSWVVAGFPEEVVNESDGSSVYYNSMMVVDRTGTLHTIYKKHFLYEQDEHWAAKPPAGRGPRAGTHACPQPPPMAPPPPTCESCCPSLMLSLLAVPCSVAR